MQTQTRKTSYKSNKSYMHIHLRQSPIVQIHALKIYHFHMNFSIYNLHPSFCMWGMYALWICQNLDFFSNFFFLRWPTFAANAAARCKCNGVICAWLAWEVISLLSYMWTCLGRFASFYYCSSAIYRLDQVVLLIVISTGRLGLKRKKRRDRWAAWDRLGVWLWHAANPHAAMRLCRASAMRLCRASET